MVAVLSQTEIETKLASLSEWTLVGNQIKSTRKFKNFIEAVNFVNKLVEPAEAAGHHPDLEISYNKVTIILSTHDAGGLTEQDFAMATIISQL